VDNEEYAKAIEKFRPQDNTVALTDHWHIVLRPKQVTLGALIALPTSFIADFDGIADDAAADLFRVIGASERALRSAFSPDRFNLIAAMMKDPFVHFHLLPRYETERSFGGTSWKDVDWPGLVSFRNVDTTPTLLSQLADELKPRFGAP
jgi:diadenosine tetraphosphate (Ap4A) HIT family hydrolase